MAYFPLVAKQAAVVMVVVVVISNVVMVHDYGYSNGRRFSNVVRYAIVTVVLVLVLVLTLVVVKGKTSICK